MNKNLETLILRVEGLDCDCEVALIDKKLSALARVTKWKADILAKKLTLNFDSSSITRETIIKELEATGMKIILDSKEKKPATPPWWKESRIILLSICGFLTAIGFALEKLGGSATAVKGIYTAAILIGGYYPAKVGIAAFRSLTLNINTLLIFGAIGAVLIGQWQEAAVLVFVYSLGSVLEAYAVGKARGSIRALMDLAPKEALVKRNGNDVTLPVEEINPGDVMIVRPGEKIPLDGEVISGSSAVDQSTITGESIPVGKGTGDEVFAGTINQRGAMEIRVTRLAQDTTLARIIHLVEEAQTKKSSYQRFGEKFGKYYTPAMFLLAILVTVIPPLFLAQPFHQWFYRGLVLLVVSCSCGLALSVPVAVVAAISNAARHGILFKGGACLEAASGLKAIAFDKTGTLTIGRPVVSDFLATNTVSQKNILSIAASIESRSEHPLAEAILRHAHEKAAVIQPVSEFESLPGLGARARISGSFYQIGSARLFESLLATDYSTLDKRSVFQSQGKTVILVGTEDQIIGIITVADQLRSETASAIASLKKVGLRHVVMLTGDNKGTAEAVALRAGVDDYRSELLPQEKVDAIHALRKRFGQVAMVGDGVNDAPAMAEANIGIAMGATGTDVVLETADIALMSDDLSRLPYTLNLSRRAINNIKQNVVASLSIVAFLVPAALFGWVSLVSGLLINEVSALIVICNGLRLLFSKGSRNIS